MLVVKNVLGIVEDYISVSIYIDTKLAQEHSSNIFFSNSTLRYTLIFRSTNYIFLDLNTEFLSD